MAKIKIKYIKDSRKKHDIKITKGGVLEFPKDTVILIDDENFDETSKIMTLYKNKIKWGNPNAEIIE